MHDPPHPPGPSRRTWIMRYVLQRSSQVTEAHRQSLPVDPDAHARDLRHVNLCSQWGSHALRGQAYSHCAPHVLGCVDTPVGPRHCSSLKLTGSHSKVAISNPACRIQLHITSSRLARVVEVCPCMALCVSSPPQSSKRFLALCRESTDSQVHL